MRSTPLQAFLLDLELLLARSGSRRPHRGRIAARRLAGGLATAATLVALLLAADDPPTEPTAASTPVAVVAGR